MKHAIKQSPCTYCMPPPTNAASDFIKYVVGIAKGLHCHIHQLSIYSCLHFHSVKYLDSAAAMKDVLRVQYLLAITPGNNAM